LINSNGGIIKAKSFMEGIVLYNLEGVITLNYDLIVEYATGSSRFNYGTKDMLILGKRA
jgi:hypothetical protein